MADTQWKEISAEEFAANPKKDPEKEALYAEVKRLKNLNESLPTLFRLCQRTSTHLL